MTQLLLTSCENSMFDLPTSKSCQMLHTT